ncbi:MAG: pyruvate kinase [Bacteroidia bacterium]|nr:pyruvate kinase [Bacteroidia bacterium]MBP9689588.1 pyruvate kinase [Bacteroidia bacterium]
MKVTNFNRTKIVATIGPATASLAMLKAIIHEGVDVCRLNFSHGSYEDHKKVIDNIKQINLELDSHVSMLLDLQGPKLRVGEMQDNKIELISGSIITVTTQPIIGTAERISVKFKTLAEDVKPGELVLLDDGKIEIEVIETNGVDEIKCKVNFGGVLSSKKGFNLPQTKLSIPAMTEKDHADLLFGLEQKVDWIGLSFVRKAEDILEIKKIIDKSEWKPRVIAKIEKPEALDNLDEIIAVSDGIMVARGDLGVEMPMEQVPVIQKRIVKKCYEAGKPVIIATQMMESMITSPSPTRAEVNDIANAVMDGADAVMLSAETSVGAYPILAIKHMQRTIAEAEKTNAPFFKGTRPTGDSPTTLSDEICFTAVRISDHLKASAIVSMTFSGYTAYKISSFRPRACIYIFTGNQRLLNTLSLVWGVRAFHYKNFESTDQSIQEVNDFLKERGLIKAGDLVINTASMPIKDRPRTNAIKISEIE